MTIWDFVVGKKMPLGFLKADGKLEEHGFSSLGIVYSASFIPYDFVGGIYSE